MKDMTAKYQRGFVIRAFTWASVNRFFIVRSLSGRPADSKPKRYSNRGGRRLTGTLESEVIVPLMKQFDDAALAETERMKGPAVLRTPATADATELTIKALLAEHLQHKN